MYGLIASMELYSTIVGIIFVFFLCILLSRKHHIAYNRLDEEER